jgi:hypothetical protein
MSLRNRSEAQGTPSGAGEAGGNQPLPSSLQQSEIENVGQGAVQSDPADWISVPYGGSHQSHPRAVFQRRAFRIGTRLEASQWDKGDKSVSPWILDASSRHPGDPHSDNDPCPQLHGRHGSRRQVVCGSEEGSGGSARSNPHSREQAFSIGKLARPAGKCSSGQATPAA